MGGQQIVLKQVKIGKENNAGHMDFNSDEINVQGEDFITHK